MGRVITQSRQFSDGGPIEFLVAGSGSEYLDLAQSQIFVKLKVTKKDGSILAEDDQVGPVNLFLPLPLLPSRRESK